MSQEKLVTNHVINLENKSETCTQCVLHIFTYFIQVHGEDFAVDLCGVLDLLTSVVSLMVRAQTVNLPPWKIISWFSRVGKILEKCHEELEKVVAGAQPSKSILPKLAEHWQEINSGRGHVEEDRNKAGTFQVFLN